VAPRARRSVVGGFSTPAQHRPTQHRHYLEWTPQRLVDWTVKIGLSYGAAVARILESRRSPEQGCRACLGRVLLARRYSAARAKAA
jgi:transposase